MRHVGGYPIVGGKGDGLALFIGRAGCHLHIGEGYALRRILQPEVGVARQLHEGAADGGAAIVVLHQRGHFHREAEQVGDVHVINALQSELGVGQRGDHLERRRRPRHHAVRDRLRGADVSGLWIGLGREHREGTHRHTGKNELAVLVAEDLVELRAVLVRSDLHPNAGVGHRCIARHGTHATGELGARLDHLLQHYRLRRYLVHDDPVHGHHVARRVHLQAELGLGGKEFEEGDARLIGGALQVIHFHDRSRHRSIERGQFHF